MGTDSFNGSGSRFNSRFVQGEETYAKQLNDLAAGVQASLPTPYLGGGSSVSYIPGGSIITALENPQAVASAPLSPFQVTMSGNDVKVVKGKVISQVRDGSDGAEQTRQYSVTGFGVYPDGSNGSLTVGTDSASPYASSGGYVTIKNAANGGSDYWGVYLIRNQDVTYIADAGIPYLAVMAVDSDAYNKSTPWLGGSGSFNDAILLKDCFTYIPQTIYDDPNPPITFKGEISMSLRTYNYNCQRIVLASMWWVEGSWHVFQQFVGDVNMPRQTYFAGQVDYDLQGPYPLPWADWPLYSDQQGFYVGTWTDYGKDPSASFRITSPFA